MHLEHHIENHFGLSSVTYEPLNTPTNDVLAVTTPTDRFALKLYHPHRTVAEVQWEVDLIIHLMRHGAPVAKPVQSYDAHTLIDEQLRLMEMHLREAKRWKQAVALGERLKHVIANPALDRGICHMDLTLDNVHRHGESITVFDFDSAGACWRSIEPHGVLRSSQEFFEAWLDGYRSVRPFKRHDEQAVTAFSILGDVRVVAWKLGVARSSRGKPLLGISDLPGVVDTWLDWERRNMSDRL
jgi:Ser/Thr protein kinase RdoA (MazF antagonist)